MPLLDREGSVTKSALEAFSLQILKTVFQKYNYDPFSVDQSTSSSEESSTESEEVEVRPLKSSKRSKKSKKTKKGRSENSKEDSVSTDTQLREQREQMRQMQATLDKLQLQKSKSWADETNEEHELAGNSTALTSGSVNHSSVPVTQSPVSEQIPEFLRPVDGIVANVEEEANILAHLNNAIHHHRWTQEQCLQYVFKQCTELKLAAMTPTRLTASVKRAQWSLPPLPVPVHRGSQSAQTPFGQMPKPLTMPKFSQTARTWTSEQIQNGEAPDEFPTPSTGVIKERESQVAYSRGKIGMMRRLVVPGYKCSLPHATKDVREAQHPPETHHLWEVLLRVRDRNPLDDRNVKPRCTQHKNPAEGDDHTPASHGVLAWTWHLDNGLFEKMPPTWQQALAQLYVPFSESEDGIGFHPYAADPVNEPRPYWHPVLTRRIEYPGLFYSQGVGGAGYNEQLELARQGKPGLRPSVPRGPRRKDQNQPKQKVETGHTNASAPTDQDDGWGGIRHAPQIPNPAYFPHATQDMPNSAFKGHVYKYAIARDRQYMDKLFDRWNMYKQEDDKRHQGKNPGLRKWKIKAVDAWFARARMYIETWKVNLSEADKKLLHQRAQNRHLDQDGLDKFPAPDQASKDTDIPLISDSQEGATGNKSDKGGNNAAPASSSSSTQQQPPDSAAQNTRRSRRRHHAKQDDEGFEEVPVSGRERYLSTIDSDPLSFPQWDLADSGFEMPSTLPAPGSSPIGQPTNDAEAKAQFEAWSRSISDATSAENVATWSKVWDKQQKVIFSELEQYLDEEDSSELKKAFEKVRELVRQGLEKLIEKLRSICERPDLTLVEFTLVVAEISEAFANWQTVVTTSLHEFVKQWQDFFRKHDDAKELAQQWPWFVGYLFPNQEQGQCTLRRFVWPTKVTKFIKRAERDQPPP